MIYKSGKAGVAVSDENVFHCYFSCNPHFCKPVTITNPPSNKAIIFSTRTFFFGGGDYLNGQTRLDGFRIQSMLTLYA